MMRPQARIVAPLLIAVALLSVAEPAEAQRGGGGLLDWINKLSGPTTYGFLFHFEVCLNESLFRGAECPDNLGALESSDPDIEGVGTYVRIVSGYAPYTRGEERVGDPADINRFFIEPWLVVIVNPGWSLSPVLGVGVGFHRTSGDGFTEFWRHSLNGRAGLRFQLGGDEWWQKWYLEGAANLRYFPDRFRSEDFGGPPDGLPVGGEWAFGADAAVGLRF